MHNNNNTNKSINITSQILTRQYATSPLPHHHHHFRSKTKSPPSPQSEILLPTYRPLIKSCYKSASRNPRKILRTKCGSDHVVVEDNPVYDILYSPKVYGGWRCLAVGDEQGGLSIVRVGFEGGGGGDNKCRKGGGDDDDEKKKRRRNTNGSDAVVVCSSGGVWNRGVTTLTPPIPQNMDQDSMIQPVLYSVDWDSTGTKILAGYGDGSIRSWDVENGGRMVDCLQQAYQKSIKRVVWGSEATTHLSCSRTNEIRLHDSRMRNPLANRIDCSSLNCKLTDISLLDPPHYVASSSSNQKTVNLWDLRYSYKLYKRIKPVQSFDCGSGGYACLGWDNKFGCDKFYCLGVDGVVSCVEWRKSDSDDVVKRGWKVPFGGVDYFSKIGVDSVAGVFVCGGSGGSAWGFDLREKSDKSFVGPFFELREGRRLSDDDDENGDSNKENFVEVNNDHGGVGSSSSPLLPGRCCSAVGIGTRRGFGDCVVQIATGGDDSYVTVWD